MAGTAAWPDRTGPSTPGKRECEIHWSIVVGAYQDKQINLDRAAELLGMTELELRDRFIELGIPLCIGPADLAEARAEVEAMRAWLDHSVSR